MELQHILEKACYNFNYLKGGIGGTNMKTEETKLTFYGNQAFAMLPLVGYILIGGTFSVGLHYYSMKGLSFAAAVSLFAGFFLCREKDRYWDSVVHGLAQYGNSRLILFLWSSAFFPS